MSKEVSKWLKDVAIADVIACINYEQRTGKKKVSIFEGIGLILFYKNMVREYTYFILNHTKPTEK